MKTKVIYLYSVCNYPVEEFEKLTDDEKLHVAKNHNDMEVYSLEGFQYAFNAELISDLGFIFII